MERLLVPLLFTALPSLASAQADGGGPAGPPRRAPTEFADRLAELAKSAPPPEPRRGDHSIKGRVVTGTGEPLAGVTIRAMPTDYPFGMAERHTFTDAPPEEGTLAQSLRASADFWYSHACDAREAVTGADGTFAFVDLVDRRFELQGWRKGFAIEPPGASWHGRVSAPVDTTVDFTAIPTASLRVELRLPDGSIPEHAMLACERFGDRGTAAYDSWTPAVPTLLLPAGDWNVTATVGDVHSSMVSARDAWFASRPSPVTVKPEKQGEPDRGGVLKLELCGVPAIEGVIRVPADAARDSMRVVALLLDPGDEPDPALFKGSRSRQNRRIREASVNSSSNRGLSFRLGPIEAGRWFVGLLPPESEAPVASAVVEVGETMTRHDFTLPENDPRSELRVRVLDPDGAALRDCRFECTAMVRSDGQPAWKRSAEIRPRLQADGAFAFSRAGLGTETILFAEHPRFGTRALTIPPDAHDLELRFVAPATPTLRLTGLAEHVGRRSVELEVRDVTDPKVEPPQLRFDAKAIAADGAVALHALQPGTYRVRVFADADMYDGRRGQEVAAATFELAAGPRALEVEFPVLSVLRLAVAAGAKGNYKLSPINSTCDDDDRTRRNAEPDAGGVVTFADVPPGLYEVVEPGQALMVVESPAPKTVAFVAEAINALRVVVTDAAGALAKAGLKSGDFVVAIDGREFSKREELDRIRQSLAADEVTLTVERKGDRFEIVVPRKFLNDERAAGGRFRDGSR